MVHVRNMTEDAWDGALANCGARHTAKLMVGGMIDASAILWNGVHLVTSFVPGEGRGWAIEGEPPVQYGFELVEKRWIVGDDAAGIVVEDILP